MSLGNKILAGIFSILLVVFLVEVGVYFVLPIIRNLPAKKTALKDTISNKNTGVAIASQSGDMVNPDQIKYLSSLNKLDAGGGKFNLYYSWIGRGIVADLKKPAEDKVTFKLLDEKDQTNILEEKVPFPLLTEGVDIKIYKQSKTGILTPVEIDSIKENDLVEFTYTYNIEKGPGDAVVKNQLIIFN